MAAEMAEPSIDGSLAQAIDQLIKDDLPETRVQERTNLQLRPVNRELLLAVQVNAMIWLLLKPNVRSQDIILQNIHTLIMKAMITAAQ